MTTPATPPEGPLSPLDAPAVEAALAAALAAVAAATDLDALKEARLAHSGDRSPLALANREIGRLAPADKAAAGKLLGATRGRLNAAIAARQTELEAERDARVLVEESVDVTLPADRPTTRSRRSRSVRSTRSGSRTPERR